MSGTASPTTVSPMELQLSSATNQMGLNFMRNLPESATKHNVVLSPLSLQIILNLILLGTKDSSDGQAELAKVLGYKAEPFEALLKGEKDDNQRRLLAHKATQKLIRSIVNATAAQGELSFSLANLMLTNTNVAIPSDEYVAEMKQYYDNVKVDNLSGDKQAMKPHERINKWVSEATKGQITQLVDETDLPSLCELALVLLNAVSFQGKWLYQFDLSKTTEYVFYNHGQESEAKKVKFMVQSERFSHVDFSAKPTGKSTTPMEVSTTLHVQQSAEHAEWSNKLDCRVLSMPFSLNEGRDLDMIFVLPNKRDGLPEVLKQLSSSPRALELIYKELESDTKEMELSVALPKFTFETTHDAKAIVSAMGAEQVFTDGQLGRLFKQIKGGEATVDKLIHKAKITVDESGAEASAASVAVMSSRSMTWPYLEPFVADRPFLFLLRHTSTGVLLFAGSINAL